MNIFDIFFLFLANVKGHLNGYDIDVSLSLLCSSTRDSYDMSVCMGYSMPILRKYLYTQNMFKQRFWEFDSLRDEPSVL